MKTAYRRIPKVFSLALLALAFVDAQSQAPRHPLDALNTQEYWAVYDGLQASGKMDADTAYASVLLHEPAKDKVLAWKVGDPISREAAATLFRKGQVIEARIEITARRLDSWRVAEVVRRLRSAGAKPLGT